MPRGNNKKRAPVAEPAEITVENEDDPGSPASEGHEGAGEIPVRVSWEVGRLASLWENSSTLRARGRATKCLTKWATAKVKGIPSMSAIFFNCDALWLLSQLWCPLVPIAKTPSVKLLRTEIEQWRQQLGLEPDPIIVHLDAWGLRRLFSLAVRRRSVNRRMRDPIVDAFFDKLTECWGAGPLRSSAEEPDEMAAVDNDDYPDPDPSAEHDGLDCGIDFDSSWSKTDGPDGKGKGIGVGASSSELGTAGSTTELEPDDVMYEPENLQCMTGAELIAQEEHLMMQMKHLALPSSRLVL